jgi:uncharacterized protein (TIGR01777 family)
MRVLVSGATGFVGKKLVKKLQDSGHEVIALTRNPLNAKQVLGDEITTVEWDDFNRILDLSSYAPIDGVINLIGENISTKRWSNEQKKKIYNSRVDATDSIFKMLEKSNIKPKVFVSTSATGFYGHRDGKTKVDENSLPGGDFLSKVCMAWEEAVTKNKDKVTRHCILRVGLVLGKNGGAMEKMLPVFRLGLGGKLGDGKQFMSWIHIDDLVKMYITLLENDSLQGIFNGVSNYSVSNQEFTKTLGKVLRKKTSFAVPSFALEIALGEMSSLLLYGANVIPDKFNKNRFHYMYPTLEIALKDVVSKV